MAIYLYSGTPGSGKSLHATYDLIDYIKSGRGVIANFQVDTSYFKKKRVTFTYKDNSELTVEWLLDYARRHHIPNKEKQTLLIIDEAGTFFNSRDFNNAQRMKWIRFFTQHRKLGYTVILVAQFDRMIDRQIRACIETEYKFRAIKNYKFFGQLLSTFTGGLFVMVEYWYGTKLRCGSTWFRFHKKKASIYDSFKIF